MRAVRAAILGLAALLFALPAFAQSTATPVVPGALQTGICPPGQTTCFIPSTPLSPAQTLSLTFAAVGSPGTLSGTTTSSNIALPANGAVVEVANGGSVGVYINLGIGSSLTASTANLYIPAGQTVFLYVGQNTYIAGITPTSTATVTVTVGNLAPPGSGGGSSNVVTTAGSVTNATIVGPLGTQAIAAAVAVNPATGSAFTVVQPAAANLNAQVVGDSASGAADSGSNPVKVGGVYLTTLPTLTTGQRANAGMDVNGNILVSPTGVAVALADGQSNNGVLTRKGTGAGAAGILENAGGAFNGTGWDRIRTIQGADGTGLGIQGVAEAPHSTNGTTGSATSAVASSLVLKASSGNLYSVNVTTGATAGFVMFFNATAAPADGAVTPVYCSVLAANSSFNMANTAIPALFGTGIVVVFSSTGCFTKAASATAFISGQFQ